MPGANRSVVLIRIVLAEVPGLLADLVKKVTSTQSDMTIVKEVDGTQNLDTVVMEEGAHVVVTSLSGTHVPSAYQRLLFGLPNVALIAISADGHHAEVYESKVIREVAVEQLVQVIREVVQHQGVSGVTNN